MAEKKPELQRGLEARHIELIALGGTIGVGLFMGAASTLKWAGPSVLLAYIIAGLFVFFIMRSMGEMLFLEPVGRDLGNYRHWGLRPVLVSGDGAVDTGADCRRTGRVGESGCGAPVW